MQTIWIAYAVAAAAVAAFLAVSGRHVRSLAAEPELDGERVGHRGTDVAGAVRAAASRVAPLLESRSIRLDIAVRPGVRAGIRAPLLAEMVEHLLAAALCRAPAGAVLVAAYQRGDRVHVSVTDDRPHTDPALRQADLREVAQRAALAGGALDIRTSPLQGTTMTLRIAAASERDQGAEAAPARATAELATVQLL